MTVSGHNEATLAPHVDGAALSFAAPQILFYKNIPQAEFVSAVWKDASGQPLHQRSVFVVKPDYGVVIDYLYGKGRHSIVRRFTFSSNDVIADKLGAQAGRADEKPFRVQAVDISGAPSTSATGSNEVAFSSTVDSPSPIPTVFLAWTGNTAPHIEPVKPANSMIVKFKVTFSGGRMEEVAVAWEARPLHLGGREFVGWAACLRHGLGGVSVIEIK